MKRRNMNHEIENIDLQSLISRRIDGITVVDNGRGLELRLKLDDDRTVLIGSEEGIEELQIKCCMSDPPVPVKTLTSLGRS